MFMCWLFTMLCVSFRVASLVSFGFVPELWGFVRLHPFVFFMDSFFFLAGFQARWSYPRNHYYLCYASLLALAMPMLWCLPFSCQPPKLPCQTSNPPFLANHCLAILPHCSAPLIALLVAGEDWRPFLVGTFITCWDIIILPCYLNASIYLVKGGRLGLSPSVLFHSCHLVSVISVLCSRIFCVPYMVGL